jgi:hypothetical protein
MKKVTARDLAQWYLGTKRLSSRRVEQTLEMARVRRWVWNFTPILEDYDRPMVLVREDHPLAPLLKATQNGDAILHHSVVEQHAAGAIEDWRGVGCYLGRHGLALMALTTSTVTLRGTSAEFAVTVNRARYFAGLSIRARRLLPDVLGRPYALRRIQADTRLRAAILCEQFGLDASGLLDDGERVRLESAWLFPATAISEGEGA